MIPSMLLCILDISVQIRLNNWMFLGISKPWGGRGSSPEPGLRASKTSLRDFMGWRFCLSIFKKKNVGK